MKTVLILGAGASAAEAISLGVPIANLPVLDKSLFRYCTENKYGNIQFLRDFVKKLFVLELDSESVSAEEIFNKIYSMAIEQNGSDKEVTKAWQAILHLFQGAIRLTTD